MEHRLQSERYQWLLLISVFVVATCGLIYELLAGTLASYLLGDSVTQFSTIIGAYLFAMGIGSYLSKFFRSDLLSWFIRIELLVGLIGGFSTAILFVVFEYVVYFQLILYTLVGLTGIMVGLEIPLLMRILKGRVEFSDLVSRIFTFDYVGALFASILFPVLFVPYLGLLRTSFFFGLLNVIVAFVVAMRFSSEVRRYNVFRFSGLVCIVLLVAGFVSSEHLTSFAETSTYPDRIVYAKNSPYQRIVITKGTDEWRLFLNGNLQFSSVDEYRYHEALVHPGMSRLKRRGNVLVFGGGDGMAVRELLKYGDVNAITLVDLDASVTKLFTSNATMMALNDSSLISKKVTIVNEDAFIWIRNQKSVFDFIVIDFPDPGNYSLGKLYTTKFYEEVYRILSDEGLVAVQCTSPFVARKSFWIVDATLKKVGFITNAYHCYVPSFGEWGFNLASKQPITDIYTLPHGLKFMNNIVMGQLFVFPPDMDQNDSIANTLNNQVLVNTFTEEWAKYSR